MKQTPTHAIGNFLRSGGWLEPALGSDEERIVQGLAKTGKRVAHSRLGHTQMVGRSRNAAVLHECIEDAE